MKRNLFFLFLLAFLSGCDFDPEAMAGGSVNEDYGNGWSDYANTYSNHCVLRVSSYTTGDYFNLPSEVKEVLALEPSGTAYLRFRLVRYLRGPVPTVGKLTYKFYEWQRTADLTCKVLEENSEFRSYECRLPFVSGYAGQYARIESLSIKIGTSAVDFVRGGLESGCQSEGATTYIDDSYRNFPELTGPTN